MTPELVARYWALTPDKQEMLLPMLTDLMTVVENKGAALLLADPMANGRASMLAVGDVHFVAQLLRSGADAYGAMYEKQMEVTVQ
jgi:hypothetical protein